MTGDKSLCYVTSVNHGAGGNKSLLFFSFPSNPCPPSAAACTNYRTKLHIRTHKNHWYISRNYREALPPILLVSCLLGLPDGADLTWLDLILLHSLVCPNIYFSFFFSTIRQSRGYETSIPRNKGLDVTAPIIIHPLSAFPLNNGYMASEVSDTRYRDKVSVCVCVHPYP